MSAAMYDRRQERVWPGRRIGAATVRARGGHNEANSQGEGLRRPGARGGAGEGSGRGDRSWLHLAEKVSACFRLPIPLVMRSLSST